MPICVLFCFVICVLSSYFALSICILGPFPSLSCTWFQVPPLLFCFMMYLAPQHPCYIRAMWFQVSKLNWSCFLFEWIFCMLSWDFKIISKCSNINYFKASQSGNSLARMDTSKKGFNAYHHLCKYCSWFSHMWRPWHLVICFYYWSLEDLPELHLRGAAAILWVTVDSYWII